MKPAIIPFFISHQGCPHTCIFCDQRTISGADGMLPDAREMRDKIALWQSTAGRRPLEAAFFGGTFTALNEETQHALLTPLQPFLADGTLRSIRISTRPDCIDAATVARLSKMGVCTVELGVQSMDDNVLSMSGRGHTADDSLKAINCIKKQGLTVGAQLMPGLPGDTPVSSMLSLKQVVSAGADFLRLYPTVVLQHTALAQRYQDGEYTPLSYDRGVSLCKHMLHYALQAGVPVIRIGLQADQGLDTAHVLAGCWHPALGQVVRSQLYADLISNHVSPGEHVTVCCHPARYSDVIGVHKDNLKRQAGRGVQMQVIPDAGIDRYELKVIFENNISNYSIINDNYYKIDEV